MLNIDIYLCITGKNNFNLWTKDLKVIILGKPVESGATS